MSPILNTIVYFSLFSWWDHCRTALGYKSYEGIDEHHFLWKIIQTHGLPSDEFLVRGSKTEDFSIKQRSSGKPWRQRECKTAIFPVIYTHRLNEANAKRKWELLNLIKNIPQHPFISNNTDTSWYSALYAYKKACTKYFCIMSSNADVYYIICCIFVHKKVCTFFFVLSAIPIPIF